MARVRPFGIASGSQFRPPAPPALAGAQYAAEVNEVKAIGSATSTTRTPDQTAIALFWADGAGTFTPPGHWNQIAEDIVVRKRTDLATNARLFALLNVAEADAVIVNWDAKYRLRPVAAGDGHPAGGHRRQRGDGGRPVLDPADRDPAVPGVHLGS